LITIVKSLPKKDQGMNQGCSMSSEDNKEENACPMHSSDTSNNSTTSNLSKERETSSIPTADGKKWIYPSEEMFFNAMKRKNHNPNEKDMQTIIPIHNIVNEQCWKKILEWEKLQNNKCETKLVKFRGRAKDYTIKARFYSLLGYSLPFDRHDWVIDRCGKKVTYVIDFYAGKRSNDGRPLSFFLDVRPSPTIQGVFERIGYFLAKGYKELFN
jgi:cytochrome c heme-lyase